MIRIQLLFVLLTCSTAVFAQRVFNITKYGAVGDGQTVNTRFIQQAIDDANKKAGGEVLVPAGKFVTGVIEMKSNVTLRLAKGSYLLATTRRIDYGAKDASALIIAKSQQHIGIVGKGTIDGRGDELLKDIYVMLNNGSLEDSEWKTENPWHQVRPEERNRPKIIEFKDCNDVKITGITIKNGLCWVQNYKRCRNLLVDSIAVESNTFWNNDGIDVVDSKDVRITNSFFNADDDGICLKSEERNQRCENVYIANCRIRSSASAFKLGTASHGGFKHIVVRNISVYDTYRSAIALEAVDGGVLEDIDISHVKATNTGNAIFIRLGHRNKDSVYSKVKGIHISHVRAAIPSGKPDKGYPMEGPLLSYPHNVFPSSIAGLPGHPVEDVLLDSIDIVYEGGASKDTAMVGADALSSIEEHAADYPEFSMFGELPAWGFFARHVDGLTIKNMRVSYQKEDFRTAMVYDDVRQLQLSRIHVASGTLAKPIVFNNTTPALLKDIRLPNGTKL